MFSRPACGALWARSVWVRGCGASAGPSASCMMRPMPVSEETLARAQRFDRSAAEAVLADSYAAGHRIARGLTGRESPAKQVVAGVLTRSLRVLPSWRKGVSPGNWFYHHTVLTSPGA